jgi:hypothetical protein
MALFTLTINNFSTAMDKQHQELQRIHSYLNAAVIDMRGAGGKKLTGNILDNAGTVTVGTWTYTPQAAS